MQPIQTAFRISMFIFQVAHIVLRAHVTVRNLSNKFWSISVEKKLFNIIYVMRHIPLDSFMNSLACERITSRTKTGEQDGIGNGANINWTSIIELHNLNFKVLVVMQSAKTWKTKFNADRVIIDFVQYHNTTVERQSIIHRPTTQYHVFSVLG